MLSMYVVISSGSRIHWTQVRVVWAYLGLIEHAWALVLVHDPVHDAGTQPPPRQAAVELLQNMEGLSARERNKLRRQAKASTVRGSDRTGSGKVGRICLQLQSSSTAPNMLHTHKLI